MRDGLCGLKGHIVVEILDVMLCDDGQTDAPNLKIELEYVEQDSQYVVQYIRDSKCSN